MHVYMNIFRSCLVHKFQAFFLVPNYVSLYRPPRMSFQSEILQDVRTFVDVHIQKQNRFVRICFFGIHCSHKCICARDQSNTFVEEKNIWRWITWHPMTDRTCGQLENTTAEDKPHLLYFFRKEGSPRPLHHYDARIRILLKFKGIISIISSTKQIKTSYNRHK